MSFNIQLGFFLFILNVISLEIGVNAQYASSIIGNGTASASNCYKCDSSIDGSQCLHQPNPLTTCQSNSKYCYIHLSEVNSQKVLRRGCVDSQDNNVRDTNACANSDFCMVCSNGDKCNNKIYQKEHCINAEYTINNPLATPSDSSSVECPISLEPLGCYHFERSGSVSKGCVSSLTKSARDEIRSSRDCEICFGNNCNTRLTLKRKCIQCDGTKSANCSEVSLHQVPTDFCPMQSDSCLVGIDVNGYTQRKCALSQSSDYHTLYPNGYEICLNDSCNANLFPNNRLKCYHCDGDVDDNCNSHRKNYAFRPTACQIYSRNDECYSYFDKDGTVFRGCMSDNTSGKIECESGDGKCIKCRSNACNDHSSSSNNSPHLMTIAIFSVVILGSFHIQNK